MRVRGILSIIRIHKSLIFLYYSKNSFKPIIINEEFMKKIALILSFALLGFSSEGYAKPNSQKSQGCKASKDPECCTTDSDCDGLDLCKMNSKKCGPNPFL